MTSNMAMQHTFLSPISELGEFIAPATFFCADASYDEIGTTHMCLKAYL